MNTKWKDRDNSQTFTKFFALLGRIVPQLAINSIRGSRNSLTIRSIEPHPCQIITAGVRIHDGVTDH